MNYIAEIKAFYDIAQVKQLSTGQIALWHSLMYINNKCAWIEWFSVSNIMLEINTGLTRDGIAKARNILKQKGFIDFQSNGTKATSYKLISIANFIQDSMQADIQNSMQSNLQSCLQNSTTLNKQNKTKHIKKESIKKKYGENENVKFTDEEFEKVKAYFPDDYMKRIQILDDYIQSTGKKYKDYFATLRTWAKKENYKPPNNKEKEIKKEEYKAIDTSQLTNEEYDMLVKKKITVEELIRKGKINV